MVDAGTDPGRAYEQAAVECVARSAGAVSLYAMREAPDADLLHQQGFHVGIEVVRTVDQSYLDAKRWMEETIKNVEAELEGRRLCGRIVVYFDIGEVLSTPPSERRRVPRQVAEFLEAYDGGIFEKAELKAGGVQCVARLERVDAPQLVLHLGWRTLALNGSLAETCLAKKDERLRYYKKVNGEYFKEYWLAIASLGPGTIEDGGFSMLLDRHFVTDFDRVFLIMRGLDGRFAEAKNVTPTRT